MVTPDTSMGEEDVYDMDESKKYIVVRNIIVVPRCRVSILIFSLDLVWKTDLQMISKSDFPHILLERACREYATERRQKDSAAFELIPTA